MGAAVPITRLDLTAQELRQAAGAEKNGAIARRLLALALVLEGNFFANDPDCIASITTRSWVTVSP